jgi:AAA domain
MICAPSNAAIDEIIFRILNEGVMIPSHLMKKEVDQTQMEKNMNSGEKKNQKNGSGQKLSNMKGNFSTFEKEITINNVNFLKFKPNIVRIGVLDKNPNELVKEVAIENLTRKILLGEEVEGEGKEEIKRKLHLLGKRLEEMKDDNSEKAKKERTMLLEQRRQLKWKILECKKNKEIQREKYDQVAKQILMEADIICSTLSSSGSDKMDYFKNRVEILIIDEAAQVNSTIRLIIFFLVFPQIYRLLSLQI